MLGLSSSTCAVLVSVSGRLHFSDAPVLVESATAGARKNRWSVVDRNRTTCDKAGEETGAENTVNADAVIEAEAVVEAFWWFRGSSQGDNVVTNVPSRQSSLK